MSLRDRILQAARQGLNSVQDRVVEFERDGGFEAVTERFAERLRVEQERLASGRHPLNPDYQAEVRVWYARLEIEYGSDTEAVRRAYRGMMRRYHPDRFTHSRETEALATKLSQDLTVAYEGLLEYLEYRGR